MRGIFAIQPVSWVTCLFVPELSANWECRGGRAADLRHKRGRSTLLTGGARGGQDQG